MSAAKSSRIAEIVLDLAGQFHALLHLILRTNSERFAIRSRNVPWTEKRSIRLFGPNDLCAEIFISAPLVLEERGDVKFNPHQISPRREIPMASMRPTSPKSPPSPTKSLTTRKLRSPFQSPNNVKPHSPHIQYVSQTLGMPQIAQPLPLAPPPKARRPTTSRYSIFPTRGEIPRVSWATSRSDSSSEIVQLPPPLFSSRHRRDDSNQSSATVQIGLRLSHAMGMISTDSLLLPSSQPPIVPVSPLTPILSSGRLAIPMSYAMHQSPWPTRPNEYRTSEEYEEDRRRNIMKSLPPVPPPKSGSLAPPPLRSTNSQVHPSSPLAKSGNSWI